MDPIESGGFSKCRVFFFGSTPGEKKSHQQWLKKTSGFRSWGVLIIILMVMIASWVGGWIQGII